MRDDQTSGSVGQKGEILMATVDTEGVGAVGGWAGGSPWTG